MSPYVTSRRARDHHHSRHDVCPVSKDGPDIMFDLLHNDSSVGMLDLLSIDSFDFTGLEGTSLTMAKAPINTIQMAHLRR
jgi:hypothetical protein